MNNTHFVHLPEIGGPDALAPRPFFPSQWLSYALGLIVVYPFLIASLRFRRLRQLHRKYPYTRETLGKMTDDEAFEIQKVVATLEFPLLFARSLQSALFKTYGIPSISHLLVKTNQFANPDTSLKRYTDTSALVQEMIGNSPTSPRTYISLARTRYLHSPYRASGKLLEDDMLYTLALLSWQPIRLIEQFEWRSLSDLERCAIGTFWKSLGDGLGISYKGLPSGETGFRDGIHWLEELQVWGEAYENKHMVPDTKNREMGDQTMAVLLYMLPKPLHPVALQFASFMIDDRLRKAMYYDPPTPFWSSFFSTFLAVRKFFLRYLSLPRPHWMRHSTYTEQADENQRFFLTAWEAAPYYVKPTFWNRWGPGAWITWGVFGRPVPGDNGDRYCPAGYKIEDMGPRHFEGKGKKTMDVTMEELKSFRTGKCPFH